MTQTKKSIVIAGNWKMYKSIQETVQYIKELAPLVENSRAEVYLAVPYTAIHAASEASKGSKIIIGAQNMHDAIEGAFTGEISAGMLIEAGARFAIIGHSERRQIFKESNEFVNRKVKRALQAGIQPILCVGESLQDRLNGKTQAILIDQLEGSMANLTKDQVSCLILAYEPVWAIGTGETATPEMAQESHEYCRGFIAKGWGDEIAKKIVIQYGGSVKAENAAILLDQKDVDGLLVGGASLSASTFSKIVHAAK
jgi:triosephosphate isomerase